MKTYEFASVRGPNFIISGENPEQAWENLVKREYDNGTIWRCHDKYMCDYLFSKGWSQLSIDGPVYREIE